MGVGTVRWGSGPASTLWDVSETSGAGGREDTWAARERELEARQSELRRREQRADDREGRADERDRRATERERIVAEREEATPRVGGGTDTGAGAVVGERWRLDEQVAAGGAGTVWRATDLRLERTVAIKVMRTGLLDEGQALKRFRREADLLARVEHEHVMALYDVEVSGDQLFLVMEFVGGMNLRELIDEHAPFPSNVVAAVGRQLATGIAAIHARGVVHRDLKPRNVVLTDRGSLKIVDFGTARHLTAELTPAAKGQVAGSPAYLAPEQVEGRVGDQRTDLYALGLILWEAATGRRPFAGDTDTATALARLTTEVPDLLELGSTDSTLLAGIVTRLTRSDPRRRFRTAWEVTDALRPLTSGRPVDLLSALNEPRRRRL